MQSIDFDLAAHDELALETVPKEVGAPRVKVPLAPEFGQCCYRLARPRVSLFAQRRLRSRACHIATNANVFAT